MTPPAGELDRRPIARLRLERVAVRLPPERAPVFHVFEELYDRARVTKTAGEGKRRAPA